MEPLIFDTTFTGKHKLCIYSDNKANLGKSILMIRENSGSIIKAVFSFPCNTNFSDAEYGKLTIIQ